MKKSRPQNSNFSVGDEVVYALNTPNSGFGRVGTIISCSRSVHNWRDWDFEIEWDDGTISSEGEEALFRKDSKIGRIATGLTELTKPAEGEVTNAPNGSKGT